MGSLPKAKLVYNIYKGRKKIGVRSTYEAANKFAIRDQKRTGSKCEYNARLMKKRR